MSKEILDIIANHTRTVVPALETHVFQPSDQLSDLGANSVDRSEIIMMTLETLLLNISLVETSSATNIGELAKLLYEKKVNV